MSDQDTQGQATDTQAPEFEATAIPESYKESAVGKYANVGELLKGYENANKLVGAKGVIVPGENAPAEEVDKYYNDLGRPEKPEGYQLTPVENLHPELKITPESEVGFKAFMHKHGIPQKSADAIHKEYFGMLSQALAKKDEGTLKSKHEAETALRNEWGAEYDTNLKRTQGLIDKFGGQGARVAFGDIGNNPVVLKTLATIADKFSEDNFTMGTTPTEGSITEAQKKITAILQDKEHMYHKTGVGHDEAVKEMMELNKIVYPEATRA